MRSDINKESGENLHFTGSEGAQKHSTPRKYQSCRSGLCSATNRTVMEPKSAAEMHCAQSSAPLSNTWARIRTSPRWIVGIALLLRVGWIVIGHTYKFKSTADNFS